MPVNLGKVLVCLGLVCIMLGLIFISGAEAEELVRVAIATDASEVKLSIRGSYQILALNTNEELHKGRYLWRAKVTAGDAGVKIGKLDLKIYGIKIQPKKNKVTYVNGRKFRGTIEIIRTPNNKLLVINELDVDSYIAGVLYHEVSPKWPMDVLEAQAIIARTYALRQAKLNKDKDYGLVSTAFSQVYGGRTSEKGRTSKAIRRTKGKVLTYKNKIFPTFYHATCAGHTEDASFLWKIDLPPLKGRECRFCQRSPHLKWKKKVSFKSIEEALERAGFKVGTIKAIKIVDRDISGRVTELEIISTRDKINLSGYRFRLAVGPNIIRSANFNLRIKKKKAYFEGLGWGHGVGMCQWGAFFMSRKGFNAEQILGYYYPGAKIKKIEEIKDAKGKIKTF